MNTNWFVFKERSLEIGMINFWMILLVTALPKETYISSKSNLDVYFIGFWHETISIFNRFKLLLSHFFSNLFHAALVKGMYFKLLSELLDILFLNEWNMNQLFFFLWVIESWGNSFNYFCKLIFLGKPHLFVKFRPWNPTILTLLK